jgi:protein-disulfide isomerase
MRKSLPSLLVAVALALAPVAAAGAPCDRLKGDQRKLAQKIQKATYPYDCCDETLDRCLRQRKVCKLAKRLRDHICRLVLKGKKEKAIKDSLERRARSMTPMGRKAKIELSFLKPAGDPGAKVTVVAYACARCPFCSKVLPDLYRMVTAGSLKGKVKLYFRPFPIRSHEGSAEGGMAFVAAQKQGKLWPYLLKVYEKYDGFAASKLVGWARELGLDVARFEKDVKDKANRKLLVSTKKEGLRNGVKATPTLFIDNQRYYGDLDHETLRDVLDEAVDRKANRQYCGK